MLAAINALTGKPTGKSNERRRNAAASLRVGAFYADFHSSIIEDNQNFHKVGDKVIEIPPKPFRLEPDVLDLLFDRHPKLGALRQGLQWEVDGVRAHFSSHERRSG
jgi:hypothetical protein